MSNLAILQHNIEKFGAITVCDVTLFDMFEKPIITLDTLKVTSITSDSSEKEITGGIDDKLLLNYAYGRKVNLEVTDALASLHSLATFWGGDIDTSTTVVGDYRVKIVTTNASGEVDMADSEVAFALQGGTPTTAIGYDAEGTEYTGVISEDKITFSSIEEATVLSIYGKASYVKQTEGNFQPRRITFKSDKFPTNMRLVGNTYVIEQATGRKIMTQLVIPNLAITPNINLTLDASGDAATFGFTGKAVSTATRDLFELKELAVMK